ncbi:MAG: hypothetical protein Q8K85_12655, partial [Hyphomicrobium sp.]|nr:hypothetical protein [Hyphomicrobium sp.]
MAMFSATAAALVVVAVAGALSGDAFFAIPFLGFLIVGCARAAGAWFFHRTPPGPHELATVKVWEAGALLGAWSFALLVGMTGAYALLVHPGTDIEILIDCCVFGYIAGVSSRNASRPLITIGQISLTCVPFIL